MSPVPETLSSAAPASDPALTALLAGAGLSPAQDLGWIRITGEDRVRWLNGMVTNSIQALAPGQGCYNFFLNAQGRIQADATVFLDLDGCALLLQTSRARIPGLLTLLDRFIIMDDIVLEDQSENSTGLVLAGPQAASMLDHVGLLTHSLPPMHYVQPTCHSAPVRLIHAYSPLVPRFELWSDPTTVRQLTHTLHSAGAVPVTPADLDHLRILEGTPCYGVDIRDRELAQETSPSSTPSRALHFSKGCYLGQEIVERIHSRGNLHRTLSGFRLVGALPAAGSTLSREGKPVGELTSVASVHHPTGAVQIALGYIRREALTSDADGASAITYPGGVAYPSTLPFPSAVLSRSA